MKRLIALLALLPLLAMGGGQNVMTGNHRHVFAASGGHSFTLVHQTTGQLTGGNYVSSMTTALPSTAAGNTMLVLCNGNPSLTISSFSPAVTTVGTPITSSTNGAQGYVGIIPNLSAGITSITVNFTIQYASISCQYDEISGVITSSPIDGTPSGMTQSSAYSTGNASSLTGSVTTTNANDAIIGCVEVATTVTFTAGTGYTLIPQTFSSPGMVCEYKVVSSSGAYNPGMTWNSNYYYASETFALELK